MKRCNRIGLWRQLRWRIIAAQMLVVLVGVVTLIATADILAARMIDPALLPAFEAAVLQALVSPRWRRRSLVWQQACC